MSGVRRLLRLLAIVLLVLAVAEELRKPKVLREWHGRLFNVVPYDLRFPTLDRFADRMWNPGDRRLVTEHPFGVGWTVNFASLVILIQSLPAGPPRKRPRGV